jgi:hypothetical protein
LSEIRSFYSTYFGELGEGEVPCNRVGDGSGVKGYDPPLGPVSRKKRGVHFNRPQPKKSVRVTAPTKQERVHFAAEEQIAVVQIQDPRSSKWLTMQSVEADPQIWTPLMHYLKSVHKKRIRVVDNKGRLLDTM